MQINVTGRKMDVGEALRGHIGARLSSAAEKYFSRSLDANVTVVKDGIGFRIDCSLHANRGIRLQAVGEAADVYAAFDEAADKIEKQLRRYKRRIKNHHHSESRAFSEAEAQSYILRPEEEEQGTGEQGTGPDDHHAEPIIIAETKTQIPHVSVGDAVMLMDLADVPAFMFRNVQNNELNVVYRRPDGNIGWIDPAGEKRK